MYTILTQHDTLPQSNKVEIPKTIVFGTLKLANSFETPFWGQKSPATKQGFYIHLNYSLCSP